MLYIALAWGLFDDEDMEKVLDAMKQDIISARFNDYYTVGEDSIEYNTLFEMITEMILLDPSEGIDLNDKYIMGSELMSEMEIFEWEKLMGLHHDLLENENSLYINVEIKPIFRRAEWVLKARPFFYNDSGTFWHPKKV